MKANTVSKRILFAFVCLTLVQAGPICAFGQASADIAQSTPAGSVTDTAAPNSPVSFGPQAPIDSPQLAAWDATATVRLTGPQLDRVFARVEASVSGDRLFTSANVPL